MTHLLAIAFFAGLLVVLAVILEQLVKANWAQIVAALRGDELEASVRPTGAAAGRRAAA